MKEALARDATRTNENPQVHTSLRWLTHLYHGAQGNQMLSLDPLVN